jgi:UDP-galactopyranose mutase
VTTPVFESGHQDAALPASLDLVCFSHLRWDFVWQRPQHLLSRAARERRTFFVEEPVFGAEKARLELSPRDGGVQVAVPHLPGGLSAEAADAAQERLVEAFLKERGVQDAVFWYYTPMALAFSRQLTPSVVVYDCMDELSAFKDAPPALSALEAELLSRADVVFTGGQSLFEAKRAQHPNIHPFSSSIDKPHFAKARQRLAEPEDQAAIPRPRLGYCGVVDERFDLELLAGAAAARPDWHFVILGPVVKIDPATLPQGHNIHYLGAKAYDELPAYLSSWDVATLPFAHNASTRFISPTKTPEYLAAGRPVVSTSIRDVIRPYGEMGLVRIAGADGFVAAAQAALEEDAAQRAAWLSRVDAFLADLSWDATWRAMKGLIAAAREAGQGASSRIDDPKPSCNAGTTVAAD